MGTGGWDRNESGKKKKSMLTFLLFSEDIARFLVSTVYSSTLSSRSVCQVSWTGKLCLPETVRGRDCTPGSLWSSEHHPLSILDYGDQRTPSHHWPASAASNLIRSREIRRGVRKGEGGGVGGREGEPDSQTDYEIIYKYIITVMSILVKSHNIKWYWHFVMTRCQLGNKRWWHRFVFSMLVSDKSVYQCVYQQCVAPMNRAETAWLRWTSPDQMVEHQGGKTSGGTISRHLFCVSQTFQFYQTGFDKDSKDQQIDKQSMRVQSAYFRLMHQSWTLCLR